MGAVGDAGGQGLLLAAQGIAKSFGPTKALRDASLELRPGEVHVLVGENGSGKSTLVKILSGVHAPDAGSIAIDGQAAPPLRSPRVAQNAGIVTVFQEVLVAEARSVLDNVWLGTEGLVRAPRSGREKRELARAVLGELLDEPVDLGTPVEELSLSHRQACGIARALVRQPRILILDEATSALDVATRDRLFAILARLGQGGVGVVFITHRMDEIVQIGDRVTVMRSGETVTTLAARAGHAGPAGAADDRQRRAHRARPRGGAGPPARPACAVGRWRRPGRGPGAGRPRAARRPARRRRRARRPGAGGVPARAARRARRRRRGARARRRRHRRGPALAPRRGGPRHRLRPSRAAPGHVRLDVDRRELRDAHPEAGRARRLAVVRPHPTASGRLRRRAGDPRWVDRRTASRRCLAATSRRSSSPASWPPTRASCC